MPKVQKDENYQKKYSEEDIAKALKAIEEGLSERKASLQFHVPRSTLQFRSSDKFNNKTTHGPDPILSSEEENLLKEWILASQRKGFPLRLEDLQESVKQFLDDNPRPNPFPENRPGKGWYKAFLRRHPDVSLRTPEAVTSASANISENDIRKWFQEVENYLNEKGYAEILKDPHRVFNGDETCFLLCPKNKRVLAAKGSKNVYQIEHHSKYNLTVMFTFSAAGEITPSMVIYPYKRLPSEVLNSVPESWGVGCSDNGWMKNANFYEYIGNVLYKFLMEKGTTFPIILFVDGHSTHLTYQTSQLCSDLNIVLVALYPNATRILQPADVSTFKPLKDNWNKAVLKFRRDYPKVILSKENFAPVLQNAVNELKPEVIQKGFEACGIFPWNPSAIDYSKCIGKNIKKDNYLGEKNYIRDIRENICISYKEFVTIVGEEKLRLLREMNKIENPKEDFLVLSEIYRLFESKEASNREEAHPAEAENAREEADKVLNIEDIPVVFIDEDAKTTFVNTNEVSYKNFNSSFAENQPGCSTSHTEQENSFKNLNFNEVIDNQQGSAISDFKEEMLDKQSRSLSESVLDRSLDKYFVWPQTPQRKNKRQTEKLPYVLTSTVRKKAEKAKFEKRKMEMQEKEQRKEERRKKIERSKIKGKTTKGKTFKKSSKKLGTLSDTAKNQESFNCSADILPGTLDIRKVENQDTEYRKNGSSVLQNNSAVQHTAKSLLHIEYTTLKKGLKVHLPKRKSDVLTCVSPNIESPVNTRFP